ncbi:Peptidase propeptide domain-containing protein [Desulfosporosinus orientis DSM 765]|uniref:Peptidase propeptide domain-containing protein n=1 Tax=Desulfosporosinus orientis (strain ATCC 19365 / DSM 765 / NCIMB 8382 / VKM B-1628 / Singapore I) TaxID=768706 RepID=G7W9U5_DESOD|nr:PepSY domain-containing protein [Desulfosporosinus orientis]AET70661.1 Peptidase propeptide domain-containing protein [Desulfosporosinus orientis DSM 765]
MKRLLKKAHNWSIGILILLVLYLTLCPAVARGSVNSNITVEQAEQIIKDYFSIPEDYSSLTTDFNEYMDRSVYSLNWDSVEESGGSFHAEVDAVSGEILSVNQWEYRSTSAKLPALTAKDAEKIAVELTSKLVTKHFSELRQVKDWPPDFSIDSVQPFVYNFRWIRVVNGIPFPGNGVSISVSGEDGKVVNYNYDWTEGLPFPTPIKVISPEKARQVFKDTPMLELHYFIPPLIDPQGLESQRVRLVYQLSNNYYGGAIDAISGRPVTFEPQAVAYKSMSTTTSTSFEAASEAEDSQVSQDSPENSRQIRQKEAVDIIEKLITIPKDFVLNNASLNPDWQNPDEQVWELNWSSESYDKEEGYLNARVNAATGDLMGMDLYTGETSGSNSQSFTRKEAQKYADDFLRRIQPTRFEDVEAESKSASESYFEGVIPENIQVFTYDRIVNGVPVSQDGMSVIVDTAAKQVINYSMSWSKWDFPKASEVLSLDQAANDFLTMHPLELNYTFILHKNGQLSLRLVYQPKVDDSIIKLPLMDAETGDPLDWSGKTQFQPPKFYGFTDIQGNYAEKEISILGSIGAFREDGETFRPDDKLTLISLLRAMLAAEESNQDNDLSEEEIWQLAKKNGWVEETLQPNSEVSRENLSKMMIRLIGMEPSAQIKDIYTVPFTDAKEIQKESLGYIALAWGMGILKLDENTLYPEQTVTRAEGAYALVHTLLRK